MTGQITQAVKHAYETQGRSGLDVLAIARAEIEKVSPPIAPPSCAPAAAA
jgi:hypothetical protein